MGSQIRTASLKRKVGVGIHSSLYVAVFPDSVIKLKYNSYGRMILLSDYHRTFTFSDAVNAGSKYPSVRISFPSLIKLKSNFQGRTTSMK